MASTTKIWTNNTPPQCAAEDLNGFEKENNNIISSVGLPLNTADNFQSVKAVAAYAANGDFYTDTGVANAYVCVVQNNGGGPSYNSPPSYFTGMRVRFFAGNTNTSASTVDVAALGVKSIVDRNGNALNSGEIQSGRQITIVYNGTIFILTDGGGDSTSVPTGTSLVYRGFVLPDEFLFEDGAAISRTTYALLKSKITFIQNGSTVLGFPQVTGLSSTADMYVNEVLEGIGIPPFTSIFSIDSPTQITLNGNATATGTTPLTFFPYGGGDGSSTFNVPDQRGRTYLGQGQGVGLTLRPTGLKDGFQTVTQTLSQLVSHQHTINPVGGTNNLPTTGAPVFFVQAGSSSSGFAGGGLPMNIMNPFLVSRTMIKT